MRAIARELHNLTSRHGLLGQMRSPRFPADLPGPIASRLMPWLARLSTSDLWRGPWWRRGRLAFREVGKLHGLETIEVEIRAAAFAERSLGTTPVWEPDQALIRNLILARLDAITRLEYYVVLFHAVFVEGLGNLRPQIITRKQTISCHERHQNLFDLRRSNDRGPTMTLALPIATRWSAAAAPRPTAPPSALHLSRGAAARHRLRLLLLPGIEILHRGGRFQAPLW
mmetsp:Transcript_7361/g.16637  ORF Transcript_7361/g.16637 Transcript_7361/m.16637 type:complete len:227 (-) Transcript_7361:792-1472(-)